MRTNIRCAWLIAICGVWALAASAVDEPKAFKVGEGGRLFPGPDVEALLARPYRIDVPMASTGSCLWAGHPTGWAFPPNSVHWFLLTSKNLGFDLQLSANDAAVTPGEGTAYPSHIAFNVEGPLKVEGAKWIAQDDVLVSRLTLTNTGGAPVDVTANIVLPVAQIESMEENVAWSFEHAELTLHAVGAFSGFTAAPGKTVKSFAYTLEGETPDAKIGSDGPDTKSAASGGAVLGSNFGDQPGDNASWKFNITEPMEDAALTIRYARALDGTAHAGVQLPGQKRMVQRMFKSTGGWGEAPNEFSTETFKIGPLEKGEAKIVLTLISAKSNINIDALYIHEANTPPPGGDVSGAVLTRSLKIEGGKSETILCALAVNTSKDAANAALKRLSSQSDPLKDQVDAYTAWNVANVPAFDSPEEALTKQYWHRATSILRKNLFHVGEGRLKDWGISEGRWTSSWYANIISYGGGHQIREARWLRNPQYVNGIIATWCANEKDNGVFPNYIRPKTMGDGQYTDWITSTVWDAQCVHPDAKNLKAWAGALKKNVDGWLVTYDTDNDGLLNVDSHWWTGMEWQPSFFYFKDFDKDKQDQQLERVDLTAYVYGNAKNLARILAVVGDKEGAATYEAIATKIRAATEQSMWDAKTNFFYSIEPNNGDKAMVKEIVGVYPFYFSMFGAEEGKPYTAAWKSILDPSEFWTDWPVASATKMCKAYSQDVTFNGKRVGGCMWNGPTWPHANSIVLSAMGATLREFPDSPVTVDKMYELFKSFTMAQFKDQDLNFPWTGEYYSGDDAKWRTDQRDYNHSTYIDILIAEIAGLRPRNDDVIEVHPLISAQMPPFVIDGVRYRNHDVTIMWSPKESAEKQADGLPGFRVYVDGKLAHHDPEKASRVEIAKAK